MATALRTPSPETVDRIAADVEAYLAANQQ